MVGCHPGSRRHSQLGPKNNAAPQNTLRSNNANGAVSQAQWLALTAKYKRNAIGPTRSVCHSAHCYIGKHYIRPRHRLSLRSLGHGLCSSCYGLADSDSHGSVVPSQLPRMATGRAAVTNGCSHRMFCGSGGRGGAKAAWSDRPGHERA